MGFSKKFWKCVWERVFDSQWSIESKRRGGQMVEYLGKCVPMK